MSVQARLIPIVLSCLAIGLSSCQFKKGGSEPTSAQPQNTKTEDQKPKAFQSIFEAIASLDKEAALTYIRDARTEEIDSFSDEGKTPLVIAAENSKIFLVEALLERKALPLKPNKGNKQNAYTVARLNPNQNAEIVAQIENVIEGYKEEMLFMMTKANFDEALTFANSRYYDLKEPISGEATFLDLVYLHRSGNPQAAIETMIKVLPTKTSALTSKNLWALSFDTKSIPLMEKLISSKTPIGDAELTALVMGIDAVNRLTILKMLNKSGRILNLKLSKTHFDYIESIINNLKGESLNLESVRRDLLLLGHNSQDKSFCSECVPFILKQRPIGSVRLTLIKALIETSTGTDSHLLSSMVQTLSLHDLQSIIKSMTPEMKNQQVDLYSTTLEGTDFSKTATKKIELLKSEGFEMQANEASAIFKKLFVQMLGENETARSLLTILESDFKSMGKKIGLSERELHQFATDETAKIIADSSRTTKFLELLVSIRGTKLPSLLVINGDSSDKNDVNASLGYILELEKYRKTLRALEADQIHQKLSKYFTETSSAVWLKYGDKDHEKVISFSLIEMIIFSQFEDHLKRDAFFGKVLLKINKLVSGDLKGDSRLALQYFKQLWSLQTEKQKNAISDRFITAIASADLTEASEFFLATMIHDTALNFIGKSDRLSALLVSHVSTQTQSEVRRSINLLKLHLERQNPRLFVALSAANNLESYKKFMAGNLVADPLCDDGNVAIDRINDAYTKARVSAKLSSDEIKILKNVCFSTAQLNRYKFEKITSDSSDQYKRFQEMERIASRNRDSREFLNKLRRERFSNEEVWINTLQGLRSQMTSFQFDNLDIFGLRATDLPIEIFNEQAHRFSIEN